MAWNDKPTDAQLGELVREYEAYLYDAIDNAEKMGARETTGCIEAELDQGIVRKIITEVIATKAEASEAIATTKMNPKIMERMIAHFHDLDVYLEGFL